MFEFGDITPEDIFTVGDESITWDEVEALRSQIEFINSIEDDEERLDAAVDWAVELAED